MASQPEPTPVRPAQPTEPVQPAYAHTAAVRPPAPSSGIGGLALRVGLTLVGAAGLIIGSFMSWFRSFAGTDIGIRTLWGTPHPTSAFLRSAGAVTVLLGLIAIVGLAPRSGWLTRLAGALGIVAFVLFVIQVYRAPGKASIADLGPGMWLVLGGAIVALVGGFVGTRHRVVYPAPTGTLVEPA